MKNNLITKTVAVGIGAALFFVVGYFIAIPTGVSNTDITLQYGIQSLFAVIFGPIVGFLVGFIGHFLIDSIKYGSPWFSWIIASGVFGLLVGLVKKFINVEKGRFQLFDILKFNIIQVFANLIAWSVVAPTLDILIYAEAADKVYLQSFTATLANSISVAIVGTLLLIVYANTKVKSNSLKAE